MRYTILLFLAAMSLPGPCRAASAPSWPRFHGPKSDNISQETGLLKVWPAEGPKLLWTTSGLGKGYSTVSVANNTIYTSGTDDNKTIVFAFTSDGKLKWKRENGVRWDPGEKAPAFARGYDGARATPTFADGRLYHLNELGRLAAFDAGSGKEIWALDITKKFGATMPRWGYSESVLIDDDRLICTPGGNKGFIVALNRDTGKTLWANTEINDALAYCSPMIVEDKGVRQLLTMSGEAALGLDADTGKLLWREPHVNFRKINISFPIYSAEQVFVSCGYGGGSLHIKLTYDGKTVQSVRSWTHKNMDNHHGGVVFKDGYVYGSAHKKPGWYCLEMKSGKEMYRHKDFQKGSVMLVGSMLYCLGEKGTMALVKCQPSGFDVVSQFKVPSGGKGLYWAHPVVCGGRLYLRHADKLCAYDIKAN